MTEETKQTQNYQLQFFGIGSEYFKIMIVNWLLTLFTLGLYYPWARAKKLSYMYGQTALNNERFHFSGTGKEIFRGFIKLIVLYIVMVAAYVYMLSIGQSPLIAVFFLYLVIFAIIPFAIHGSFRYRMSRTSYRGIRFGYRGNRNELLKNFYTGIFFTIISFGFYSAWLQMNIRRYTHSNIRFGEVEFSNDCSGGEWFALNIKGYLLSIFTLGIYSFWWQRDIFRYYIDNMSMTKGEQKINCQSTASVGDFFNLIFINLLITVFTLGFGKAWADIRTQNFLCDNVMLLGNINIDEIQQTEEEYTNAFGEDAMDFFDIDLA